MFEDENVAVIEGVPRDRNFRRGDLLLSFDVQQSRLGFVFDVVEAGSDAAPKILDAVREVRKKLGRLALFYFAVLDRNVAQKLVQLSRSCKFWKIYLSWADVKMLLSWAGENVAELSWLTIRKSWAELAELAKFATLAGTCGLIRIKSVDNYCLDAVQNQEEAERKRRIPTFGKRSDGNVLQVWSHAANRFSYRRGSIRFDSVF
jgi:hypothetical protein